ncbi:MAG: hypothetical protein GQF41_0277 [Candidatus Rifleibacterium amylolyticum]|nr:MAG: hypothetical protein GQF41_0277 [Candidatus Rifleibacterium amylolyticum]
MKTVGSGHDSKWLRLLPYFMFLLPVLVLNLGFYFLANIERHWNERRQDETARQELEALTRSSNFEYQFSRRTGKFVDQVEKLLQENIDDPEAFQRLGELSQNSFSALIPDFKLHFFKKSNSDKGSELFFTRSSKIESKRVMALIFDYMLDLHQERAIAPEIKKQRNKLAQSYFGKTVHSEAYASSQKGRISYILHDRQPHWFIWDYHYSKDGSIWGYFIAAKINDHSNSLVKRIALEECSRRGTGLAAFIPLIAGDTRPAQCLGRLEMSPTFQHWRKTRIRPLNSNLAHWLAYGAPQPEKIGNFKIFSYLGEDTDHLTVFLSPLPKIRNTPRWIRMLNLIFATAVLLLSLRGLLLNIWFEPGLKWRFLMLYFLAATFPLGILTVTAIAYHYQTAKSAQNQIAENLEGCLRQFETRKTQIQEEYQNTSRLLFTDSELSLMIEQHGIDGLEVKDRILDSFRNRDMPLPLLGFYLLDLTGKGIEFAEAGAAGRLKDIFAIYRAQIIINLRNQFAISNPSAILPEFKLSEEEKLGAKAYSSVTGNPFLVELEKRRNFVLSQSSGGGTASLIYDYLNVQGHKRAALFIAWDGRELFEKSIRNTIESFKTSFPEFSFIAFKSTPQGLKILFQPESTALEKHMTDITKTAESAVARGGSIKEHLTGLSVVAMPFGNDSEVVIAGVSSHSSIEAEGSRRQSILIVLLMISLFVVAICAYFTAAFLLTPITELKSALAGVTAGNYNVHLDSVRTDELGNLTHEFASMIEGIKERERLASLLSDHAVEALAGHKGTGATNDARAFTGIALVSDIRSFTTLCETYDTNQITAMLNHHFAIMASIIASNDGKIYKFIGDAIEAVFNGDNAEEVADKSLKAALEMHAAMKLINQKRASNGEFTYKFGVGLAYGELYAGSVGNESTRLDYCITSEAFRRAGELEALTRNYPHLPVAFDDKIAGFVSKLTAKKIPEQQNHVAMTIGDNDEWSNRIIADFSFMSHDALCNSRVKSTEVTGSKSTAASDSRYNWLAVSLIAFFAVSVAFGVYLGLAFGQHSENEYNKTLAQEQLFRLIRQIKSEKAFAAAYENAMLRLIKDIESDLSYRYNPAEGRNFSKNIEQTIAQIRSRGIEPSRVFAVSCKPENATAPPDIVYSLGIGESHKDHFFLLANYFCNYYQKRAHDHMPPLLDPFTSELFGMAIPAQHLCTERIAISTPVKNGELNELFYWKYVLAKPESSANQALPAENHLMAGWENDNSRIAGLVMFAIPEKLAQKSIELLVHEYSDEYNQIAAVSNNGVICKSHQFPQELIPSLNATGTLTNGNYAIASASICAGNDIWQMSIVRRLPRSGKVDLNILALLLACITAIGIRYFHLTVFGTTGLARSIQHKLIASILLTAVIPMFTVMFVSNYFSRENHRVMLHQQKLEIKHFLDTYEYKLSFDNVRVINMLTSFARNSETLKLARQLDQNPESEEVKEQLRNLFHKHLDQLSAFKSWCFGTTLREAVLVSRKNWDLNFSNSRSREKEDFANVLSQIGKHVLSQMSSSRSDDLTMKDLKSDLFYDSAMQSIRSNFGDEAYIKTTNAINQMVEFEVTTGAAGMLTTPLPSIEHPEFMIVWLTEQRRGNYFTIMAKRNKGPFAIFTVEHQAYGELSPAFKPLEGLNLEKAATWISGSHLPVSYDQPVGKEIVSIEGRQGIKQLSNIIVGAGAQTPVYRETEAIKTYLLYFILLALMIFIVIGHQTAADIITPVRLLTMGMRQIGQQNYFYRIALDRSDELGQLCASFDHFAQGLAEKQIMGKMLSRSAQKAMAGENSPPDLLGKRKDFVFVFIGSLNFAERLSNENTETLFARLKEQTAVLCRCIIEQGGDIDKLMGDKILGIFEAEGAPQAEAARQAAIEAAQKIMQTEQTGELHFPVAIGVNAGTVISGMLGFGAKRDFTVIGDAVNVSARIEKEAEKLPEQRCLFSHDFVSGLSDTTRFKMHSEAALKGKAAALRLYRLT